jgi:hypothetical protein
LRAVGGQLGRVLGLQQLNSVDRLSGAHQSQSWGRKSDCPSGFRFGIIAAARRKHFTRKSMFGLSNKVIQDKINGWILKIA